MIDALPRIRRAVVVGEFPLHVVQSCLPTNYNAFVADGGAIHIIGSDKGELTLEDYVLPTLASEMIFAEEFRGEKKAPTK